MITNLTQFFQADSELKPVTNQAMAIERKLKHSLKEILGKNLIAIKTIYWVDECKFYFNYALLCKRLPPEDMLLLHVDLERQHIEVTEVRNLDHSLFIEWSL